MFNNDNDIEYKTIKPNPSLYDYVESFWMLANHSDSSKEVVVLPDGRVDIFFSYSPNEPYHVTLMGLGTKPEQALIPAKMVTCAVSFKLLAIEYLLHTKMASLLNSATRLPVDFWDIAIEGLNDFESFFDKVTMKITALIKEDVDVRKQKLFEAIYASNGSLTVKELSLLSYWSSRQINRYFNQQFGISLKAFCNILRFTASLEHLKKGKFFPGEYTDQAHFIKEVKKFSGVVPKELFRNKNDRFIQFSAMQEK